MRENENKIRALVAKALGGIAFLAVLFLNITVLHQKGGATHLSVISLKSFADSTSGSTSGSTSSSSSSSSSSSGSSSDYYYTQDEAYTDNSVDTSNDTAIDSAGVNNLVLKQVVCVKAGFNFSWPVQKSTFTISLGHRMKCLRLDGSNCDYTKQTSCN